MSAGLATRRLAAGLALAAVLQACGDDKDDGGAGGGGSNVTVVGTVPGSLADATAIRATGPCSLGVEVIYAAAIVTLASVPDVCGSIQQGRDPRNATGAVIALVRGSFSQSVPLATGTYELWDLDLGSGQPPLDDEGHFRFMFGEVGRNGSTEDPAFEGCVSEASASISSGSVTITSITATSISGTISAGLDDGGTISGSFTAPTCAVTTTVGAACAIEGIPASTCQ